MRSLFLLALFFAAMFTADAQERSSRKRGKAGESSIIDGCKVLDERTKYFVETLLPQTDTVKLAQFIAAGISINQCAYDRSSYYSETVLTRAISFNKPQLVSFLIRSGADPNLRIRHTHSSMFTSAQEYVYSMYPLEAAARLQGTAMFETLLQNGAKLELCQKQVQDIAAQTSNLELLNFLSKRTGTAAMSPDALATMLEFSYERRFDHITPAFINEMVRKGADVNAYSSNGNTPLQSVMRNKAIKDKTAILKALLQNNADPNKKENRTLQGAMKYYPKSATQIAVELNNLEWVKLFFENGAKPEKDLVRWAGSNELKEYLILRGAN